MDPTQSELRRRARYGRARSAGSTRARLAAVVAVAATALAPLVSATGAAAEDPRPAVTPRPAVVVDPPPVPEPSESTSTDPKPSESTPPVAAPKSKLPRMDVELPFSTQNLSWVKKDKENRASAKISITDTWSHAGDPGYNIPAAACDEIGGKTCAEFKGRGNFTWRLDKRPYQIKLDKSQYNKLPSVVGLDPAKTWILLANRTDASFMRNKLAFDLGTKLGMPGTPDSTWIELYINGQPQGNYLLSEKVQVNKARLNIGKTGVISELDNNYGTAEAFYFRAGPSNSIYTLKDSDFGVPDDPAEGLDPDTQAGWNAIRAKITAMENELAKPNPSWSWLEANLDIESFIKFYFMYEFTSNPEVNSSSIYFYINDPGDKLHAGPIWDFDSSLYQYDKSEWLGSKTDSDYVKEVGIWREAIQKNKPFNNRYHDLFSIPQMQKKTIEMWNSSIKAAVLSTPGMINSYNTIPLQTSAAESQKIWPIYGKSTFLMAGEGHTYKANFAAEVAYLKTWVQSRVNYLDRAYNADTMVNFRSHVQGKGWLQTVYNGGLAGTMGESRRVESFNVGLTDFGSLGALSASKGQIQANAHVQSKGWMGWSAAGNNVTVGTTGQGLRMEAIQLKIAGPLAAKYKLQYRAHVSKKGWLAWAADGATAGTTGQGLPIEALQVRLVRK